jgi:chromosome segregation ATPase
MPENMIPATQYDELKSRLEKAEASAKEAAEKAVAKEKEIFQTTIAQLEKDKLALANELSATKEVVKAHETKVTNTEKELAEVKTNLAKANDDLAVVAKQALKANRLAMFTDVDVDSAKAEELVNKFLDTSDDIFAELVKAMPKKKTDAAKDDKEDDKKKADAAAALAQANLTDDTQTMPPPAADKKAEVVKATSAWLTDKLFKSTAKKGDK